MNYANASIEVSDRNCIKIKERISLLRVILISEEN